MHIISFNTIREFFENDPGSKVALQYWYKKTDKAVWQDYSDIKKTLIQ